MLDLVRSLGPRKISRPTRRDQKVTLRGLRTWVRHKEKNFFAKNQPERKENLRRSDLGVVSMALGRCLLLLALAGLCSSALGESFRQGNEAISIDFIKNVFSDTRQGSSVRERSSGGVEVEWETGR